ncbi:MAG TPA: DUF4091 domain-containing protein [Clostridia bacterium]|nr:DUF4091 domain-containing protein [Clostridia bacterium]
MKDYKVKAISSLEKCFYDDDISEKKDLNLFSCLKNEKLNFQIAFTIKSDNLVDKVPCFFHIESELTDFISIYKIESVPCRFPVYHNTVERDYQRNSPYCYPDLLDLYDKSDNIYFVPDLLQSLFIEINLSSNLKFHGLHNLRCFFTNSEKEILAEINVKINIINSNLSDDRIIFTQWFHGDCLASYYNVKPLSKKHFIIMENFLKTAYEYGINAVLTPVLTPPLDTKIGGERPTMQLVDIVKTDNGYKYSYEMLDKWISMCKAIGFEYFEISHFFTQWGALHAPKVIASVNGRKKKIFGWDTDASSEEYIKFLRDFISCLLTHLKNLGIEKKFFFHISDEPNEKNLEGYNKAKKSISDLFDGYLVTDALSSIEFYKKGIVNFPIPSTDKVEDFINYGVKDLWTYYCCGQYLEVSNRYIAMPSYRNRIIGTQLYKYNIKGFLHWGYNFYYNQYSRKLINPFLITDGDFFAPSGDAYSVYPGDKGLPVKSLRLVIFNEALQDIRAFKKLESLTSYDYVMNIIENHGEITFKKYPRKTDYIIELRKIVNNEISKFSV